MYRKNVASQSVWAQMNSRSDGSPLTSSVSVYVTNPGNYGSGGGTLTHRGSGLWEYVFTQAETNYNQFGAQFVHASGVDVGFTIVPTAADPTDAAAFGLSRIDAAVTTRAPSSTALSNATWTDAKAGYLTGDAFVRLGAPIGASISADIQTVDGIVDTLISRIIGTIATGTHNPQSGDAYARIGAAGAGLTAIPWNSAWDAEVESEATDALNAYDPPTAAELAVAVADVSVDEIQATALADLFNTDSGTTYSSAVAGSVVKEIADNAGGSALTEAGIADAVLDELLSGHTISGSLGEAISAIKTKTDSLTFTVAGDVDVNVQSWKGSTAPDVATEADVSDAVWDELLSGHTDTGSAGKALSDAGVAGDPWSTALPGSYGAGTAGKIIGDNVNATISSRSTLTAQNVWEYATRTLSSFGTLVSDIWAAGTRTLTSFGSLASDVWSVGTRTLTSFGTLISDIWSYATRTLSAFGFSVTVGTNNDKTGYALTAAYDPAKTAASQSSVDTVDSVVDAAKAVTDKLDTAMELDGAVYRFTTNSLEQAPTGGGTPPTVEEIRTEMDTNSTKLTAIKGLTDKVETAMEADGGVYRFTTNALEQAPSGGGGGAGSGAIEWDYVVKNSVDEQPIPDVDVWVTSDVAGANLLASGKTDQYGSVTFYLDAGTVYVWRQKSGWNFTNPDTEVVS